jgi:hypothetical protein
VSGDEEETHGFMDVTHNICCCISPEAVAEGKREAYNRGAKDALRETVEIVLDKRFAYLVIAQAGVESVAALLENRIDRGEWPKAGGGEEVSYMYMDTVVRPNESNIKNLVQMSTQEALEAAFQKVVENARAGCCACEREATALLTYGTPHTCRAHTCDATIDAAAEGMLAAATAIGHNPRYPLTEEGIEDSLAGKHDEQTCSACRVEATIKRLIEEAKK